MKKLVVLMVAMLIAAGALWAQAAAPAAPSYPQITVGGLIQYQALSDFAAGREFSDQPRIELKWTMKLDDFNTAYIELEEYPEQLSTGAPYGLGYITNTRVVPAVGSTTSADAGNPVAQPFDKAWFMTDWGKSLKLPFGLVTKFGFEEFNNIDWVKVTKSEWEDRQGEKDIRKWGMQIDVTPIPVVTLRTQFSLNPREKLFDIGAYGYVAPVWYEVTYFTNGYSSGTGNYDSDKGTINGWLEGGFKFMQDLNKDVTLGVAAEGQYDMADYISNAKAADGTLISAWTGQIGARAIYQKMASLGLSWRTQAEFLAGGLQVEAWAQPIQGQPLELIGQVGFGLDSDLYDNMFDSLEAVVKYTIGKASFYLGLLYGPEGSRMIAKEWVDMNVAPLLAAGTPFAVDRAEQNDTTALFIRGTLAF